MKRIVLLVAAFAAGSAGAVYKCVDEKGRTLIGDVPPEGCANVVMYEVSQTGMVLRKIDPTPTPEQERRMREEQEKRKAAERIAAEQKRRDMALLNTYSSEREFDVARDRNIEPIKTRIAAAKERIATLDKHRQEVEDELEFYKAGSSKSRRRGDRSNAPPPHLLADLERGKKDKATLEAAIVKDEQEIEDVKARFETDKKRWIEVKAGAAAVPASSAPAEPRNVKRN